jgi:hypothetical protein
MPDRAPKRPRLIAHPVDDEEPVAQHLSQLIILHQQSTAAFTAAMQKQEREMAELRRQIDLRSQSGSERGRSREPRDLDHPTEPQVRLLVKP